MDADKALFCFSRHVIISVTFCVSFLLPARSTRTGRADLSSTIQRFHTMTTGDQQPNSPQHEAALFCPGGENQRSKWGCKWNVVGRKSCHVLCVGLCAVPWILVLVLVAVIVLQRPSCSPCPQFSHVCPNAWVGFQGKCYYFSNNESDWNSSREHCQRLGASLATIDTANCWIGLHREEGDERWTWADGSAFTNWFQVRGGGQCAYLNGDRITSGLCHVQKYWVCSRADSYILWRNGTYPQ
ncbi:C-type lectin domain family 2 member B-like [Numida meleagris]|uniref:C-type lectin domain family 2 member B-like n=1 Tax=Numida meleagris TaxID=8996 RepID=UPI000B3E08F1|nr:C-type lectin domain family 2 member B-like [Numida meleagris]